MIEGLGKAIGGKLLSAVLLVSAALIGIWYWRMPPAERAEMWGMARGALLWMGFVAALPWALFFVPGRVVRAENNWVSGLTLLAYLVIDAGFAWYLIGGHPSGRWQAGILVVGLLIAAAYNFAVCEYLAQRSDESL
jgi:hypothetical protein